MVNESINLLAGIVIDQEMSEQSKTPEAAEHPGR